PVPGARPAPHGRRRRPRVHRPAGRVSPRPPPRSVITPVVPGRASVVVLGHGDRPRGVVAVVAGFVAAVRAVVGRVVAVVLGAPVEVTAVGLAVVEPAAEAAAPAAVVP